MTVENDVLGDLTRNRPKYAKLEKLKFAGSEVIIDPANLAFNEATLGSYIEHESGYYDNFGAFLALAEKNLQQKDLQHEKLYNQRYIEAKESGGTDKLAEAKAKADQDVIEMKEDVIDAKYIVNRLKQHLRAWDKNHDNAQSMGHMLRKTMDKLNAEIMMRVHNIDRSEIPGLDKAICETVETEWPTSETEASITESGPEFETDLDISNLY